LCVDDDDFICSNKLKHKIAMIATRDKTFKLDKPSWIAALMDAYMNDRKRRKYITVKTF